MLFSFLPMGISLCMIVKNEEAFLESCLRGIKDLVDEIIIVDTGSTDRSKEIAQKHTDKVFSYAWNDDFSKARNFSLQQAKEDWILCLDADEMIAQEDFEKIRTLIQDKNYVAFAFAQVSYTNDGSLYGYQPVMEDTYAHGFLGYISCNVVRLFRHHQGILFAGSVHESVDDAARNAGTIFKTDIEIHHYQFEKGYEKEKEKQLMYLDIYKKNIERFTNKAKVYRDMGIICSNYLGQHEQAIAYFYDSLRYNDRNDKTYVGLILCFYKMGKLQRALEIAEKAIQLFPEKQELTFLRNFLQERVHQKV